MQFLNKRLYADELINTAGMIVASGAVGRIHLGNSSWFLFIVNVFEEMFLHFFQSFWTNFKPLSPLKGIQDFFK